MLFLFLQSLLQVCANHPAFDLYLPALSAALAINRPARRKPRPKSGQHPASRLFHRWQNVLSYAFTETIPDDLNMFDVS